MTGVLPPLPVFANDGRSKAPPAGGPAPVDRDRRRAPAGVFRFPPRRAVTAARVTAATAAALVAVVLPLGPLAQDASLSAASAGQEAAQAAQGAVLSVGLSPVLTAEDLRPGETFTLAAHVSSGGNQPFHAQVRVRTAVLNTDGGFDLEDPGPELWSAGGWLSVEPSEFDLAPNERRDLTVTVKVPEGTPDGEYFAAFSVTAAPTAGPDSDPTSGISARLSGSVASVICIAVGQGIPRSARLVPYGDVPRRVGPGETFLGRLGRGLEHWWLSLVIGDRNVALLAEGGVFRVFAPLANTGRVHIQPRVTAVFKRGDTVVGTSVVTGDIILPGDKKVVEVPWPTAPLYGRYSLELKVEYGGPEPLTAVRDFLILPVKGILGLTAVAFGLGYLAAGRPRRRTAARRPAA